MEHVQIGAYAKGGEETPEEQSMLARLRQESQEGKEFPVFGQAIEPLPDPVKKELNDRLSLEGSSIYAVAKIQNHDIQRQVIEVVQQFPNSPDKKKSAELLVALLDQDN